MTWFKVDDGLHKSRKVLSIPRSIRLPAIGLWTIAGSWSASEELDGLVPDYMVAEWGGTSKLVGALVTAGLWEVVDDGLQFHKWAEYQPTRAELEAARTKEAERKRRWRERRTHEGVPAGVPVGQDAGRDAESENPDPTRPDPTRVLPTGSTSSGPRKRGSRIPDPFIVTAEMRSWAATRTPLVPVDDVTERFVNYWRAKAGRDGIKLDWLATWQNWLLRDNDDRSNRKLTPIERAQQTVAAGRRVGGQQITSLDPKGVTS